MKLRSAIDSMCRQCSYDKLDRGSCWQQVACCTLTSCPLFSVRPVRCSQIPKSLLDHRRIRLEDLDQRARVLVRGENSCEID
jgi:hypothetical protein